MKVVLFCGGMGLRIRDAAQRVPKPMVPIGDRPLLLHVMKYYAHYGHTEFILCLGYQATVIKEYFLNNREVLLSDFELAEGGRSLRLLRSEIEHWRITFADTGLHASIGQRLCAVKSYIGDDEYFLANYADAVTDLPLPEMIAAVRSQRKIAGLVCVRPRSSFHVVSFDSSGLVRGITPLAATNLWINAGYFLFHREIFDYIRPGEDLVEEPFRRLIAEGQLFAYRYEGFWAAMDTLKDHQMLEQLYESGQRPWAVWEGVNRLNAHATSSSG